MLATQRPLATLAQRARTKGLLFRAAALLAGACVAVGMAELVVRLKFRYNTPDTVREASLQYAPSVFSRHRLIPNTTARPAEAWGARDEAPARTIFYRINSSGYRGREVTIPKPAGVIRIVAIGGSSVFDTHASEGEDWPSRVEQLLRTRSLKVEVVNAGIPGHAVVDGLGRFYSQLWTFEPDYVLVYGEWNDIKYWRYIAATSPLIDLIKPLEPSADPFTHYRGTVDRWLSYSQLYVKLRNAYFMRLFDIGPEGARQAGGFSDEFSSLGPQQFELALKLLVRAVRAVGAVPVLITEATLIAESNTEAEKATIAYDYAKLSHLGLQRAFATARERVLDVGRMEGVQVLDAAGVLSGRPHLFTDQIHTTAAGSRQLAELVASFMSRELAETAAQPQD
jgi:hypothetical protein